MADSIRPGIIQLPSGWVLYRSEWTADDDKCVAEAAAERATSQANRTPRVYHEPPRVVDRRNQMSHTLARK